MPIHAPSSVLPISSAPVRRGLARDSILLLVLIGALGAALVLNLRPRSVVHLDPATWRTDPAAAMAEASAERPVLALFTADWCGPCQTLKSNVFADSSVAGELAGRVVPLYVDLTSPEAGSSEADLAARHAVQSIPTMILMDGQGAVLGRRSGVMSAGEFTAWLDEASAGR